MQACKGLRNIFSSAKITLVPTKEMADVLSVKSKSVDLSIDAWVRVKLGIYKGDLAKVWSLLFDWLMLIYIRQLFILITLRLLMLMTCTKRLL